MVENGSPGRQELRGLGCLVNLAVDLDFNLEGNGEPSKGFKQGSDLIRLALEEHFLNHLWIAGVACSCARPHSPRPPAAHTGKGWASQTLSVAV